jgi:hypothetical protein
MKSCKVSIRSLHSLALAGRKILIFYRVQTTDDNIFFITEQVSYTLYKEQKYRDAPWKGQREATEGT